MKNNFIKQAIYLPIFYFGTILIASLFAVNYSQIGQQVSELALNENQYAIKAFTIGIFITGISLIVFSIGLIINFKSQLLISFFITLIFGISFVVGSMVPVGSPWHSLYGLPFSIILLPFSMMLEIKNTSLKEKLKPISVIVTLIMFLYFWNILAENLFVSFEYRGITQRIFGIALFSWFSYSAYVLSKFKAE